MGGAAFPTVALALSLGLSVWSQDKDLEDGGVDVFTTGDRLDPMREQEEPEQE
jgi:predicted nucleic acid-binding protein